MIVAYIHIYNTYNHKFYYKALKKNPWPVIKHTQIKPINKHMNHD